MIHENERISRRQYLSICFLALLSPVIRQLPRVAPRLAGSAAWLSGLASLPILLLYARIIRRLHLRRAEGEGMGEVFLRVYGKGVGSAVLSLYALWMLCYSGFVIAASADRLLTTAYPLGGKYMFIFVMGALGLLAVLSRLRTLARSANLLRPVLLATLLAVIGISLFDADLSALLPVTGSDLVPVLQSGAVVSNVLSLILSFSFLENRVTVEDSRARSKRVMRRLVISVFARDLAFGDGEDMNLVELTGTLCKAPNIRVTPMGREICDLMIAVNRRYGRSDYLPCIAWGMLAREAAEWQVGDKLSLTGRLQSRRYIKLGEDGSQQEKTAFEVSVSDAEKL